MYLRDFIYLYFIIIYYLVNKCEVFTGELLPAVQKTKGNNSPVKTEQMSLICSLLYGLFVAFVKTDACVEVISLRNSPAGNTVIFQTGESTNQRSNTPVRTGLFLTVI